MSDGKIAYKSIAPYDKEIAEKIIRTPPPISTATPSFPGFEYVCIYKEIIKTGSTYSGAATYQVPKEKVLFITDAHLTLYIDNWDAGVQGNGYARITTNDIHVYVAMLYIKGGRRANTTGDSSDHLALTFPTPLRIANDTTITFLAAKTSNHANSIFKSFFTIHGYLLDKRIA